MKKLIFTLFLLTLNNAYSSGITVGTSCVVTSPTGTCSTNISMTNNNGTKVCLWRAATNGNPLTIFACYGTSATSGSKIWTQTSVNVDDFELKSHIGWPTQDPLGLDTAYANGILLDSKPVVAEYGKITVPSNCTVTNSTDSCSTEIFVEKQGAKKACLWRTATNGNPLTIFACHANSIPSWSKVWTQTSTNVDVFELLAHDSWPTQDPLGLSHAYSTGLLLDNKNVVANLQQTTIPPVVASTTISCANKYCMTIRGTDFDADASVRVRENTSGSSVTVFAGNDIYSRSFTTAEDKIFFPIQNISLQNKWNNNGLCFSVNNNGTLSNEMCIVRNYSITQPLFMGEVVQSYPGQDPEHTSFVVKGNASPLQGGNLLKIWGNSWKKILYNYNVTANTVLEFDFRSNQQEAEINGIGFILAGGTTLNTQTHMWQIHGTQPAGRQEYHNYTGTDLKTYSIPIGQYFTGQISQMVFLADEDVHVGQNVAFRSPKLVEVLPPQSPFMGEEVVSVAAGVHDIDVNAYSVSTDGSTLTLTGNTWKAIANDYYVDGNTVLEFEFQSTGAEAEINSIGFSNSLTNLPLDSLSWKINGTEITSHNLSHDYYNGNGWKKFTIPVGEKFSGLYQYLVFSGDDDGKQVNQIVKYKNVILKQRASHPPLHAKVAKRGGSNYHWFKAKHNSNPADLREILFKYAIIKNYNKSYNEVTDNVNETNDGSFVRDIVREQLAQMHLEGQERLRIGIWHSRSQWSTESSPFYFYTKGRADVNGNWIYLKPEYLNNIYNFMVDIKEAGFSEVMFAFFPSGPNRATTWKDFGGAESYQTAIDATFNGNQLITTITDPNNEPLWIENWNVIKQVKSMLDASGMNHIVDLSNEGVHRTPIPKIGTGEYPQHYMCLNGTSDTSPDCVYYQSRADQMLKHVWEKYIKMYGSNSSVGYSIISRSGTDFNERKNTLASIYSNSIYPQKYSIHVYDGEASSDNAYSGLNSALQWFKNNGRPSIIIGETDYNDTTTASEFIRAMNQNNYGIDYISQWPVDRSAGYNITHPMQYNRYLNKGF